MSGGGETDRRGNAFSQVAVLLTTLLYVTVATEEMLPLHDGNKVFTASNGSMFFQNGSLETWLQHESFYFVKKLFALHGNATLMKVEELQELMERLGIGSPKQLSSSSKKQPKTTVHSQKEETYLLPDGHMHVHRHHDANEEHDHDHDHSHNHDHDHSHDHDHDHGHDHEHNNDPQVHSNESIDSSSNHSHHKRSLWPTDEASHPQAAHEKCMNLTDLLALFHIDGVKYITQEQFAYLCPALVYQMESQACNFEQDDHDHDDHAGHDHGDEKLPLHPSVDISSIPGKVWGFSCLAVVIISLVGLLGVAVIPIMQKVFYNHLLQFLVALAVGALCGDAMLHLIPHSIIASSSHDHGPHGKHSSPEDEEHDHSAAAWKGLAGLGGILFFFIMERLLTIITVIKRNKRSRAKLNGKYPRKKRCEKYCHKEDNKKSVGSRLSHQRENSMDGCDKTVMMVHPNKALKSYADAAHEEFMHQCDEEDPSSPVTVASDVELHTSKSGYTVNQSAEAGTPFGDSAELELIDMEKNGHHSHSLQEIPEVGHSHGSHAHSHSLPNSVAAVAWMVILGDGIHNFSDGLAIGAAFANSITGGVSTSVAVFCHELPHEIGDFAVLLRAGMSAKQAIMYNCLSSLLCFMGMLVGVAIGNISSASLWIFAVVGGMFMYIALVDMLPEMSAVDAKKGENPFFHLMIQVIGIVLGSSIMLLIALFEHDIKLSLG